MDRNTEEILVDMDQIAFNMLKHGDGEIVLLETYCNEGIAIIEINNPGKRNAISGKMMSDFRNCITKLESWKQGKAVIILGRGQNFCSGGDLDFVKNHPTQKGGLYFSTLMRDILKRLEQLPLFSVALVHGATLGGGTEVAVACDYILVSEDVKFAFVQGKLGIITAWGAATRLTKAIGTKKALDLLLTSRILTAQECLDIGLASGIVTEENKLEDCLEWTRRRTRHSCNVTRAFKLAVSQSNLFDESLRNELELFLPLWGCPENREALSKNIKHVNGHK
ncbi:unnamed protein product [Ceutorhynchus assimilis]|uniref:Ethylmalonyl-CoA decarboxylase n=1 Tax=Ceutorhynchus assimilis TaxID=467358 RepID=A0A9N9MMB3_9CUCU|nr:unnamed protein product [Ceutorhynchus assimilis]